MRNLPEVLMILGSIILIAGAWFDETRYIPLFGLTAGFLIALGFGLKAETL